MRACGDVATQTCASRGATLCLLVAVKVGVSESSVTKVLWFEGVELCAKTLRGSLCLQPSAVCKPDEVNSRSCY